MPFTAIIDVAIGMMVIYLVLSLICTTINEIIATTLKLRAKLLQTTVSQLIDDPVLRDSFYSHGLIGLAGLSSVGGATPKPPAPAPGGKPPAGPHPSYFDSRTFAMALLGSLDKDKALPAVEAVKGLVSDLPASKIKDVLVANVAVAGDDLTLLRNSVADWFDSNMARLNGEYVRKAKIISFGVGLVLAVLLNVDSFSLGTAIWKDHHLQQQAVTLAGKYLKGEPPQSTSDASSIATSGADKAAGATPANAPAAPAAPSSSDAASKTNKNPTLPDDIQKVEDYADDLRPFPLGWETFQPKADLLWWVLRLFGWLVTALALSLGAPFWFDLLKRMMSLRGTGAVPDTEAQKAGSQKAK